MASVKTVRVVSSPPPSKASQTKKKKTISFRGDDAKKQEKDSLPLPLTDTVLFHKEQAPSAISATRSLKHHKSPKEAVAWETYKPALHIYSLKTTLMDGFQYYVRVNSVSRSSKSQGSSSSFTWNCTLMQTHDGETRNLTFSFPPTLSKSSSKHELEERAFWIHLEVRRHASEKQNACKKEAEEAILALQHELQLLLEQEDDEVLPSRSMSSHHPSTATVVDLTKASPPNNPTATTVKENDYFQAFIACSKTSFENDDSAIKCLEGKLKGGVYRISGKILKVTDSQITIEVHAIRHSKKTSSSPEEDLDNHVEMKEYTIRNDPTLLIWKTYTRVDHRDPPKVGQMFESKISCNVSSATWDKQWIYGDRIYIKPTCLRQKEPDAKDQEVVGTVTKIQDKKWVVSLYLKESPLKQIFYGNRISQTGFELYYNPSKYELWKNYKPLVEDGTQLPGTIQVTLENVPGDGSCFFYALFEALTNRRLFDDQKFQPDILSVQATRERPVFMREFRSYLAENMKKRFSELLQHLDHDDLPESRSAKIEGLSKEFQDIIESSATKNDKIVELQKAVEKSTCYVSEPEVQETQELLSGLGIFLDIKNGAKWKDTSYLYNMNLNRIVLVNNNDHYKWYKFPVEKKGGRKTRRRGHRRRRRQTRTA
jgi:hypothetical protein